MRTTVLAIGAAVGLWLLGLSVALIFYGRWPRALLTGAGFLANGVLVYLLRHRGRGCR